MYLSPMFREERIEVQHELIRTNPFGLLVISGPDGLNANPLPFVISSVDGTRGTLRAHFSRANPLMRDLLDVDDCLVVFQGPHKYITPSWYPTKQETGKVVPTWNYATVHAWGKPRMMDDAPWLLDHLNALTQSQESTRPLAWKVDDAPEAYIAAMMTNIIGLEIPINRIEGKWKVSQNRSPADRQGVVDGLLAEGEPGRSMACLVAERMVLAPGR